jgi:hypothetical protein
VCSDNHNYDTDMIKFKGEFYDVVISDGNIILQSLKQDVIFEGAAETLADEASKEWYSVEYAGERLKSFVSRYIDDNVQTWVTSHADEGVVMVHQNN